MTPEQIMQAALSELQLDVTKAVYDSRLAALTLLSYEPETNTFCLSVPDADTHAWLETNLRHVWLRILAKLTERACQLEFVLSPFNDSDDAPLVEPPTPRAIHWPDYGIPKIFLAESLDTLQREEHTPWQKPELQNFLRSPEKFLAAGIGLILLGTAGLGKTHLAVGVLKVAVQKGFSARFIGATQFLDALRTSYDVQRKSGPTHSEAHIMRELGDVDVLVLDDLRADSLTAWSRDRFAALINYRWEHELPTIVTSNFTLEELAYQTDRLGFDEGTLSRLAGTALVVTLTGEDYRRQRKRQRLAALTSSVVNNSPTHTST